MSVKSNSDFVTATCCKLHSWETQEWTKVQQKWSVCGGKSMSKQPERCAATCECMHDYFVLHACIVTCRLYFTHDKKLCMYEGACAVTRSHTRPVAISDATQPEVDLHHTWMRRIVGLFILVSQGRQQWACQKFKRRSSVGDLLICALNVLF